MIKFLWKIFLFFMVTCPLFGQTGPVESDLVPSGLVLPWQTPGLNVNQEARTALKKAQQNLGRAFLQNSGSLAKFLRQRQPQQTMNAARLSETFLVGNATQPLLAEQTNVLTPIVCPLGDRSVLLLQLSGLQDNLLYASSYVPVTKKDWDEASRQGLLATQLSEKLLFLLSRLPENQRSPQQSDDALKVALTLNHSATKADEGHGLCLNALLAHQLLTKYRVLRELGQNETAHARHALRIASQEEKATRRLVMHWNLQGQKSFPMRVTQKVLYGESVFANSMERGREQVFAMASDLKIPVSAELAGVLDREKNALPVADFPQVAKIDRAWAYVDRGRGWGLKMNDRVIHRLANGEVIKGHVVGFYGPTLNIQSPRGFPVQEGAIIYIRKGQSETRVGQTLEFDPTNYPTAWPPTKTP